MCTAWVALQDTDLGNGAMRTIVGSHRWGLLQDSANFGKKDLEGLRARLSTQEISGAWIDEPCVLREGEVSFHHCLTLHGSGPNLSDTARLCLISHMMPGDTSYRESRAVSPEHAVPRSRRPSGPAVRRPLLAGHVAALAPQDRRTHRGAADMGVTHRIRIHWGYYMQYAPYPWHHAGYTWDGGITVEKGAIRRCWLVDFSGYYGDVRETLVELQKPQWNWEPPTTQNRLGGIMFELDGDAQSRIRFSTKAIEFDFTVGELLDHGVIRKHLGQPYSNVDVTVIQDGFDPLLDQASELEAMTKADGRLRRLIHATDITAPVYRWFRADWAWAPPGRHVELAVDISERSEARPDSTDRFQRVLQVTFRCVAAAADPGESIEDVVQRGSAHRPGNAGDVASLPYRIFVSGERSMQGGAVFPGPERSID